jgi:hypothetical protein
MPATANHSPVLPTLASQALPRRVRELLAAELKLATDELQPGLNSTVKDFVQQVVRIAGATMDHATRQRFLSDSDHVGDARADFLLHFFNALEAELALFQDPQLVRGHMQVRHKSGAELSLVKDHEIEETSVLTDAASRAELANSLPLFLLGQRFGVMAGRPAFDAEALPVGPQALCRSVRYAVERLDFHPELRLAFYRAFDRQVMPGYGALVERLNTDLARRGVLTTLQYVPVRARRTEQTAQSASAIGDHGLSLSGTEAEALRTARTELRRRGVDASQPAQRDSARRIAEMLMSITQPGEITSDRGFDLLRHLMASRRQLLGKLNPDRGRDSREAPHVVSATDLQEALWNLQSRPVAPIVSGGHSTPRNIGHLKQDMLAMLRRVSPGQSAPALSDEHNDALDLVSMLYDSLLKDLKPGSNAAALLSKLQVPLMRVALADRGFFTRSEHPARLMINTVAETGVNWLGDEEPDSALLGQVHSLVDRAVTDYHGDPKVFQGMVQDLIAHLQAVARKAEVSERRHVEAARGKEKLTLAREHATAAVAVLIKDEKLPRFTRTMLSQAWTDVMALTALRHGEESAPWRRQLEVARRLIEIAQVPDGGHPELSESDRQLQREIEEALERVGYQGNDVTAIARRLVQPNAPEPDDASSRTELTMRLKARARLGEELQGPKSRRIPLTSAESTQLEHLQQLQPGAWFEFTAASGETVRRRLAWLSTGTGEAMFVNQRGQKNAEYPLEALARMLAKGQVRIVEEDKGKIIDRAWDSVLNALRSFALPASGPEGAP